jgi:hypothetical protein
MKFKRKKIIKEIEVAAIFLFLFILLSSLAKEESNITKKYKMQ